MSSHDTTMNASIAPSGPPDLAKTLGEDSIPPRVEIAHTTQVMERPPSHRRAQPPPSPRPRARWLPTVGAVSLVAVTGAITLVAARPELASSKPEETRSIPEAVPASPASASAPLPMVTEEPETIPAAPLTTAEPAASPPPTSRRPVVTPSGRRATSEAPALSGTAGFGGRH
jgi:hypothetical protein